MEKSKRKVNFLPRFFSSLNNIQEYIYKNSPQNVIEFGEGIISEIESISKYPFIYKEFRYLKSKNKFYRYKLYHKNFFIVFKINEHNLLFIEVIDTRMSKKKYTKLRINES